MEQNARLTSSLGKRALGFLKSGAAPKIIVLFAVGLALVFFGVFAKGERSSGSTDDLYSDEEARLAALCAAVEGVGDCRVMISVGEESYKSKGRVESVCIACEGAGSASVRKRLTELISALYGIGSNRIYITRLE